MPIRIGSETKVTDYSATFTVPSDCTYLVALVARSNGSAVPSATWNGVSMTNSRAGDNGNAMSAAIFTLASPATGTQTFALSTAAFSHRTTLVYLKQVDSGSPIVATNAAGPFFTSNPDVTVTSVASALVLDVVCLQVAGTLTAGAGQTSLDTNAFNGWQYGVSEETASGTSTAMSWSSTAAGANINLGIAIRDGGGSGPTPVPSFGRYGVRGPVR
jgi:hypothetical protein